MAKKDLLSGGKASDEKAKVASDKEQEKAVKASAEKIEEVSEENEAVEEIPEEEKSEHTETVVDADEAPVSGEENPEVDETPEQNQGQDLEQTLATGEETIANEAPVELEDKIQEKEELQDGEENPDETLKDETPEGGEEALEIDPNAVKNELLNRGSRVKVPKPEFSVKDVLRQRQVTGKQVKMTPKQEIEYRKKGLSPKQELKLRRNITK